MVQCTTFHLTLMDPKRRSSSEGTSMTESKVQNHQEQYLLNISQYTNLLQTPVVTQDTTTLKSQHHSTSLNSKLINFFGGTFLPILIHEYPSTSPYLRDWSCCSGELGLKSFMICRHLRGWKTGIPTMEIWIPHLERCYDILYALYAIQLQLQ